MLHIYNKKFNNVIKSQHTYVNHMLCFLVFFLFFSCSQKKEKIVESEDHLIIELDSYSFMLEKEGFRYSFQKTDGAILAPAHPVSGLQIGKTHEILYDAVDTELINKAVDFLEFEVICSDSSTVTVTLKLLPHAIKLSVAPQEIGKYEITLRTGPLGPAYGMADHAAAGNGSEDLVLEDFVVDPLTGGHHRMISNFTIFPQQGLAEVNMEPGEKLVRITNEENAQGSKSVSMMTAFYYFMGSPKEIYKAYLEARNSEGYRVDKPKYEWFGVGWEAFGALSWNTNYKTVSENINQYLDYGYPLKWMVVGSGFWPSGAGEFDKHGTPYDSETKSEATKKLQATTSFGMWDEEKYPDPKAFIEYFHKKGLIFTIGLRIAFIPGGPFTDEGIQNGYFIKNENDMPALKHPGFPRVPVYLLDSQNPRAVDWYVGLCDKWLAYGVDGFKEDLFGHSGTLRDDLVDPINRVLMEKGVYIMGRNNYLGSPVDIHRYNDFNYNQPQDRGPINGLAYGFSGFPYVYPDIVGGTGLATNRFGEGSQENLKKYLIRYAQYAALNPSMAFGYGPWNFDEKTNELCLEAAKLHDRLHPYIYSNAVAAYHSGFPYTFTPLPLAYPLDKGVYGLADTIRRSYEWMIGEALLAGPLYGADYATATSRNIYLPKGKWIDYDTGEEYQGPVTLDDFQIPLDKAPLFVGGTGIVIEEINGQLKGRIYPVIQKSEMVFYAKDGGLKSTISNENPVWESLVILDQTIDKELNYQKVRHAYEFELTPGHNYVIK